MEYSSKTVNSGSGGSGSVSLANCVTEEQTPQLFCLRWNNYQSNLTNVFDQLLQNESFVDVTLACADGHTVKAHKMVLSACSPYFQALFFENPCKHPIVILKDIKWTELKAAVQFMYKGEINVCQEQIGPLLKVAESLKIRGLADVSNEQEFSSERTSPTSNMSAAATSVTGSTEINRSLSRVNSLNTPVPSKKRRRTSADRNSSVATEETNSVINSPSRALELVTSPSLSVSNVNPLSACGMPGMGSQSTSQSNVQGGSRPSQSSTPQSPSNMTSLLLPPSSATLPSTSSITDDMEIKPGIAEMILEEERARMLESSQAWLNASTSSLASDSYQYQLQSMWQKCWSTNQSLVNNLRFRERGPLKSWRPETMAGAILSVLKEGLSLSQAARKYDIPYPTFVLYANRVHNMLGPSVDGGSDDYADLRPKGRGRPQRILLGYWPQDHISNVIRTVVFRDPQHIKDEPLNLGYPRFSCFQEPLGMYGNNNSCLNSPEPPVSPNSTAAAAVVAMAQGLRQQMLAAAVAHNNSTTTTTTTTLANNDNNYNFFNSQCANGNPSLLIDSPLQSPHSSPPSSPVSNDNLEKPLSLPQPPPPAARIKVFYD